MSTTTVRRPLADTLEARLAAIKNDGKGITAWSEAEEKLRDLAYQLVDPYDLPEGEMRASEKEWVDRVTFGATVRALEAAERVLIDRLAIAWADPPTTLVQHPDSEQLRADLEAL